MLEHIALPVLCQPKNNKKSMHYRFCKKTDSFIPLSLFFHMP